MVHVCGGACGPQTCLAWPRRMTPHQLCAPHRGIKHVGPSMRALRPCDRSGSRVAVRSSRALMGRCITTQRIAPRDSVAEAPVRMSVLGRVRASPQANRRGAAAFARSVAAPFSGYQGRYSRGRIAALVAGRLASGPTTGVSVNVCASSRCSRLQGDQPVDRNTPSGRQREGHPQALAPSKPTERTACVGRNHDRGRGESPPAYRERRPTIVRIAPGDPQAIPRLRTLACR